MAALNTKDLLVDEDLPFTILLVDRPERLGELRHAFEAGSSSLLSPQVCGSLSEAQQTLGERQYDAAVVAAALPDSWPADTFTKVRSAAPDLPVVLLVQTDQDVLRLSPGELGPFVTVREAHADPSLLRTLVVSAALLGRALRRFPDARVRSREASIRQPDNDPAVAAALLDSAGWRRSATADSLRQNGAGQPLRFTITAPAHLVAAPAM